MNYFVLSLKNFVLHLFLFSAAPLSFRRFTALHFEAVSVFSNKTLFTSASGIV